MQTIELSNSNNKAIVDDSDYESLSRYSWYETDHSPYGYAATIIDGKHVYMHRLIYDGLAIDEVDHINHDGLDNRRENLRPASRTLNARNTRGQVNATSKYKGVSKARRFWVATISNETCSDYPKGKKKHIGCFDTEEDAARAYDAAAVKYSPNLEYEYLNFPSEKGKGEYKRRIKTKPIESYDRLGNVVERFDSGKAAEEKGYNRQSICRACRTGKTSAGLYWRYAD